MARSPRKPASGKTRSAARKTQSSAAGEKSERERIIEAFMGLLGEQPIEEIGLAEIAGRAGVSLAELRNMFGSKLAILAAFQKEVDRQVLAGIDADMAEEPPRERLFDVLMRRIDALIAAQGGGALADPLGRRAIRAWRSRSTALRCARSNGC